MSGNWENILAVGAHFDDIELGCGGTLLKHVAAGDKVTAVVITDSGYRAPDGKAVRAAETARDEGGKAARMIGCDLVELGLPTLHVSFDENLTAKLNGIITDNNIDTIYGHWTGDVHRDHRNAGKCCLMAGRHVPRHLMYQSNYYDSGKPFRGNFYSDISEFVERKMEIIGIYKSELERTNGEWATFFRARHKADGLVIGVPYAEAFEIVRYLDSKTYKA